MFSVAQNWRKLAELVILVCQVCVLVQLGGACLLSCLTVLSPFVEDSFLHDPLDKLTHTCITPCSMSVR